MKYLLTGGSGNLGAELKKLIDCDCPNSKTLNITNISSVKNFDCEYDVVIHCAAYTNVPKAEVEKDLAESINIRGTENLVKHFKHSKIIYISTDYVYDGINGNHKETDIPHPFNFYGRTKLEGEKFINLNKDLIIRTSFKPNVPWKFKGAFFDLYSSADYVDVIAEMIYETIKLQPIGIFNIGTERKSIFELACRRNSNIIPISRNEIKNVKLPFDISLNIDKYNMLVK